VKVSSLHERMSFFMFYGKHEVIKVLDYGWSDDQKYLIQDYSGNKYLLRRSPKSKNSMRSMNLDWFNGYIIWD
jgi:hypothetical protein